MRSLCLVALVGCGFSARNSPGAVNDASSDGLEADADASSDAAIDAPDAYVPDARACFGSGFGAICLTSPPMEPLVLTSNLAFDTGAQACTEVVTVAGTERCVLAGTTVTIPLDVTFRALGSRPFVIVASDSLIVSGSLSVSSLTGAVAPGAGASIAPCTAPQSGAGANGGGGGGAGGSFSGRGGNGGSGDLNGNPSTGGVAAATVVPDAVRGGCPGGNGGNGGNGGIGGGGSGGGAMYLIAGTSIVVDGGVFAAGQGGGGATIQQSGGGGGGAGGLLGLDAPTVTITGRAAANGGGGGEGSGFGVGNRGSDGLAGAVRAPGGQGEVDGGNGGLGSGGVMIIGDGGAGADGGAGGGGGGAGFIYVKGAYTQMPQAEVSPAATVTP